MNFVITGNPTVDSLILKLIGFAASATGAVILTWLNAHGFNDPNLGLMVTGAITSALGTVAVLIWGWVKSKADAAKAVNAGINLQVAGQSIMQSTGDGKVTPKLVTSDVAAKIVKEFGSVKVKVADEPALTNQLNARSAEITQT